MFDNASTAFIRQHFEQWAADAPQREQELGAEAAARESRGLSRAQRYRFCIQIDDDSLQSIVNGPIPEDYPMPSALGYFKIIRKDWGPDEEEEEEEEEAKQEPLEGCALYNVGWMRVRYSSGMLRVYSFLRSPNGWDIDYRLPPEVAVLGA